MKKNSTKVTREDLTELEERFCQEFHKDLKVGDAYRRAGGSSKNAESIGSRMLKRARVRNRISELSAASMERTKVDADWLLNRLVGEAEADMADLYDDNGCLKPVREWPKVWRLGLIQGVEVESLTGSNGKAYGTVSKIKMGDRMKRLDSIGRHIAVGAFKDYLQVEGLNDDAADRIEAALQRKEELALELKALREKVK